MLRYAFVLTIGAAFTLPVTLAAQAATTPRIRACSLLTRETVRQHLPWHAVLDQFPAEEEPIGAAGSSCNYPSVFIQILPFSQGTLDAFRKSGGEEAISGVGDVAYFRHNRQGYAELAVKVGSRTLTLQANVEGNMETVKPATIRLAKALVEKLR